ncbi:ribosomal L1 domain-containing protein 1-like [Oncorhynchus clarkii lewisi]|uniref:ribosomal L1 domain-containing protein 1-like n=1 Tax=Oncorhynchus clarkii lewisi TaxID=490388 RepID=UPI0039B98950
MADKPEDLPLDRVQTLLLDESQHLSLFTLWKILKQIQTIPVYTLFWSIGGEAVVLITSHSAPCLMASTPEMTPDQIQQFCKKVILYKTLGTEYKPFEAKRRLLGNFDMFLSDDRIRRLLSSHIGKHFYERKKEPLSLNLQSKKLALDIQGTTTTSISKKGCYCMAYVAHSGMAADELAENIDSAVSTIVTKLRVRKDR